MPTNQPSNTDATDISRDAHDDRNAAAVVTDERLDDMPGGGGLGSQASANDPLSETAGSPAGTAPNAVLDIPVPTSTLDEHGQNPSATRTVQTEAAAEQSPDANPLARPTDANAIGQSH